MVPFSDCCRIYTVPFPDCCRIHSDPYLGLLKDILGFSFGLSKDISCSSFGLLQGVLGSTSRTAEGYTRCLFRTGCVTEISVTEAFHNLSRYLFPLHHQIVGQKSASLPILTYCLHKSIDLKLDPFKNSTASPPPPFSNKFESIINMVRGDPNDTMTSNDSSSSTKSGTGLVLLCQH